MVFAMSEAAPSQPRRPSSKAAASPTPALRMRFRPFVLSAVKVADRAAARSASPMPAVAASTSARMSVKSLKLPWASVTATVVSPIWIAPSCMDDVMSRMMAASAVPASLPFRPWFAIMLSRLVTVSTSCPAACRFAAQFLYASPSAAAVVLEFACAYASMSANLAESFASSPKALR